MLIHSVYFWLKEDLSETDTKIFTEGIESLKQIESISSVHIGKPADTNSPVIDNSYSFSLIILFDDMESHNAYQIHDLHQKFIKNIAGMFDRIVIYDAN